MLTICLCLSCLVVFDCARNWIVYVVSKTFKSVTWMVRRGCELHSMGTLTDVACYDWNMVHILIPYVFGIPYCWDCLLSRLALLVYRMAWHLLYPVVWCGVVWPCGVVCVVNFYGRIIFKEVTNLLCVVCIGSPLSVIIAWLLSLKQHINRLFVLVQRSLPIVETKESIMHGESSCCVWDALQGIVINQTIIISARGGCLIASGCCDSRNPCLWCSVHVQWALDVCSVVNVLCAS